MRRAIFKESLSLLAHGALLPLGIRQARHEPERRADLRTLVFIHGLAGQRAGFLPLQLYLRANGFRRQLPLNYRSAGSIEGIALQLKRWLDSNVQGGRIDIIAHSMGGLVARFYLQCLGGDRRVDRLITLGTPHCGTHAANFVPSALVRQLLPESPLIRRLNQLPAPQRTQVTSLVAGRDLIVQPVDSAHCPFGDVRRFDDLGHVEMLFSAQVFGAVREKLATAKESSPVGASGGP